MKGGALYSTFAALLIVKQCDYPLCHRYHVTEFENINLIEAINISSLITHLQLLSTATEADQNDIWLH